MCFCDGNSGWCRGSVGVGIGIEGNVVVFGAYGRVEVVIGDVCVGLGVGDIVDVGGEVEGIFSFINIVGGKGGGIFYIFDCYVEEGDCFIICLGLSIYCNRCIFWNFICIIIKRDCFWYFCVCGFSIVDEVFVYFYFINKKFYLEKILVIIIEGFCCNVIWILVCGIIIIGCIFIVCFYIFWFFLVCWNIIIDIKLNGFIFCKRDSFISICSYFICIVICSFWVK